MKIYTLLFLFICFGSLAFSQESKTKDAKPRQLEEINEQGYLDILASFDRKEDTPSFDLNMTIGNAQMYLMRNSGKHDIITFYDKASEYAKRTNQIQDFIDLKSNKAQMLISNTKPKEGILILDSLIENYEIEPSLLGRFHKAKADAYGELGDLKTSEYNYLIAKKIAVDQKDTFNIVHGFYAFQIRQCV